MHDSLRELNAKLLAEIAKLRKENAEIPKLREKLLIFAEGSTVDGMALSFGQIQNDEEVMPVVMVPTVDVPDSVIDQLNNEVG
ncbi:hypothetical protein RhiirC2_771072 [Rhizophagus irregularis]|uniref:Uncharacterized protein n=1 Tax=Rhizophagus irregularis TaxID=588596 RepID=A0A2N1NUS4_9GLOM|nr:hypothetical protein RhiirC2_771072 [Rhizophagus irregularis]